MPNPTEIRHNRYQRIRAYLSYKAVSTDLFKPINGKDLSTLHQWTTTQRTDYYRQLIRGYTTNRLCHQRRTQFRDQYVPKELHDPEHQKAIEVAKENEHAYETLLDDFAATLHQLQIQIPPIEPDTAVSIAPDVKLRGMSASGKVRKAGQKKKGNRRSLESIGWKDGKADTGDWKVDWAELIRLVETELEGQVETMYSGIYKGLVDLLPEGMKEEAETDGTLELALETTITRLANHNSAHRKESANLTWADQVARAATVFAKATSGEIQLSLAACLLEVQNVREATKDVPEQDPIPRSSFSTEMPPEMRKQFDRMETMAGGGYRPLTEEDVAELFRSDRTKKYPDEYIRKALLIHLALHATPSLGAISSMSGHTWFEALQAVFPLTIAKTRDDLIGLPLPDLNASDFHQSPSWFIATLPGWAPNHYRKSPPKPLAQSQFLRIMRSRLGAKKEQNHAGTDLVVRMVLRILAGDLKWEASIYDPREFIISVHETDIEQYRHLWDVAFDLLLDESRLSLPAGEILKYTRVRMTCQFTGTTYHPTMDAATIAELKARPNPIDSTKFFARYFRHVSAMHIYNGHWRPVSLIALNDCPSLVYTGFLMPGTNPTDHIITTFPPLDPSDTTHGFQMIMLHDPNLTPYDPFATTASTDLIQRNLILVYFTQKDGTRVAVDLPEDWRSLFDRYAMASYRRDETKLERMLAEARAEGADAEAIQHLEGVLERRRSTRMFKNEQRDQIVVKSHFALGVEAGRAMVRNMDERISLVLRNGWEFCWKRIVANRG
ncbi:hypothetical protein HDV00_007760 [Rhizophlyctis rosea]|nr:hypothetical protein HDV00_007760 [Rhizophlyctis rosea]